MARATLWTASRTQRSGVGEDMTCSFWPLSRPFRLSSSVARALTRTSERQLFLTWTGHNHLTNVKLVSSAKGATFRHLVLVHRRVPKTGNSNPKAGNWDCHVADNGSGESHTWERQASGTCMQTYHFNLWGERKPEVKSHVSVEPRGFSLLEDRNMPSKLSNRGHRIDF